LKVLGCKVCCNCGYPLAITYVFKEGFSSEKFYLGLCKIKEWLGEKG